MSAQTENAASMAPEKVEKMKATAVNTESVDHKEVSKPIFSKLISVNDDAASMTAKAKTPEDVEIKVLANDEMEAESDVAAMKENVKIGKATASTDKKRGNINGENNSPSKKQRTETGIKKSAEATDVAGSPSKGRGRGKVGKNKTKAEAVVEDSNDVEGADAVTASSTPSKKGRARGKAATKVQEAVCESNEDADKDKKEIPVPTTPAKKGRGRPQAPITPPKTPKAKASKRNQSEGGDETDAAAESSDAQQYTVTGSPTVTKKGTPRKRAATGKAGKTIPISTSYETAIPADKMIVKFKEEGKSWNEIREKWAEMTGQESKGSTLPNRYTRLIANFMHLYKGDDARLLDAEAKATADINATIAQLNGEKWQKVMKLMEEDGTTQKYPTIFLQKEFEKLVASGVTVDTIASASDSADDDTTTAVTTNEDIKNEDGGDDEEMDEADIAGEQTGQDHDMDEAAAEASS